jgi:hypothetical protein
MRTCRSVWLAAASLRTWEISNSLGSGGAGMGGALTDRADRLAGRGELGRLRGIPLGHARRGACGQPPFAPPARTAPTRGPVPRLTAASRRQRDDGTRPTTECSPSAPAPARGPAETANRPGHRPAVSWRTPRHRAHGPSPPGTRPPPRRCHCSATRRSRARAGAPRPAVRTARTAARPARADVRDKQPAHGYRVAGGDERRGPARLRCASPG